MSLNNFRYSTEKNTLKKEYLVPIRVVTQKDADNADYLLVDTPRQAVIGSKDGCILKEGAYVVLDFGSELHGGVSITTGKIEKSEKNPYGSGCTYGKLRLVFGESVSEALSSLGDGNGALNDHAFRDMTVDMSNLSTQIFGSTGYRFLKIEAVDGDFTLSSVKAVFEYKDLEYKGSFTCSDERINEIFNTAAYTVHLNMQDYIWDGIKRDRLVWIGDMHPEVSTIMSVFGDDESIRKSLDLCRDGFSLDNDTPWMIYPSYSGTWITIHRDYYIKNGDMEYLLEQKEYLTGLVNLLCEKIHADGSVDFLGGYLFVDWSSANTPEMEAGFRGSMVMALNSAADIFEILGDKDMKRKCLDTVRNLKKIVPEYKGNKQVTAMCYLSGLIDEKTAEEILTTDLLSGLSTFYGYYVLLALSKMGRTKEALEIVRGYWGAMLDLGATTFWEDFDIDWCNNAARIDEIVPENKVDVHTSYGKHCYIKLRHSLCHGWASGPAPFLMRHILGVEVLDAGCKKIKISPNLCGLEWVKGTYPTPYGVIEVEHKNIDGKVVSTVKAPNGVEVIQSGQEKNA